MGWVFKRSFLIIRPPSLHSAADIGVNDLDKESSHCLLAVHTSASNAEVP